jgi:glutamyl-tRNA synthetase
MRTALINYLFARKQGGQFMLRIDDTDDLRSTAEFEASIRHDLEWMGMTWDDEDRQSERIGRYQAALEKLLASGRAYKCFETEQELSLKRKAQLAAGRPPVYDRAALKLTDAEIAAREAEGERPHYRFRLDDVTVTWADLVRGEVSVPMSSLSDPVILRADGRVIYTLASVVDDIDHSITHILRGEDHTTNSAAQIQLFQALGCDFIPAMGHFALLAGADGEGLSKRLGSLSIASLRDDGIEAMAVASLLSRIGTSDPAEARQSMAAVVAGFDITRFGRATPRFDVAELAMMNSRVLGGMDFASVAGRLDTLGVGGGAGFWNAVRGNIASLAESRHWFDVASQPITPIITDAAVTEAAQSCLPEGEITDDTWGAWTKAVMEKTGLKGGAVFAPLRLALTGQKTGPELKGMLPVMGRERILARLKGEADFQKGLVAYLSGDYATAHQKFFPLAEAGDAKAQYNLGRMYDNGYGVAQDYTEAVRWYRLAAEQGDADAQFNLGVLYAQGKGVVQDFVKGYMWANLAAAQGGENARELRDKLNEAMTPEQITEGQRLARQSLAANYKGC